MIRVMLNNAKWAPTHRRTEPWLFHVLTENKLRDLGDFLSSWYKENTPPESFSEIKHEKTKRKAIMSSHVIAICMRRDPLERIPEWEEIASVACAVQNMWLTCTAMNLGCYWSTPGSIRDADAFLGLGEGEKCLGWFYIGIPAPGILIKGIRSDITDKAIWHNGQNQ